MAPDPLDLEAQAALDAEAKETERVKRLIEIEDLKWMVAHKQGRRFCWRQLEKHGVFRSSFSTEPLEMAFLEGQRNDGLRLLADILEHAPDRYVDMMKEHRDARANSGKPGNSGTSSDSRNR